MFSHQIATGRLEIIKRGNIGFDKAGTGRRELKRVQTICSVKEEERDKFEEKLTRGIKRTQRMTRKQSACANRKRKCFYPIRHTNGEGRRSRYVF